MLIRNNGRWKGKGDCSGEFFSMSNTELLCKFCYFGANFCGGTVTSHVLCFILLGNRISCLCRSTCSTKRTGNANRGCPCKTAGHNGRKLTAGHGSKVIFFSCFKNVENRFFTPITKKCKQNVLINSFFRFINRLLSLAGISQKTINKKN